MIRSGMALGLGMALLLAAEPSQASHKEASSLTLGGLVLANMTLLPAYYSLGYYAWAWPEKPMPVNWATMNCVTAALGASVGFYGMFRAGQYGDLDHQGQENHSEVLLGVFGGATVGISVAVIASSIVMARRPANGYGDKDGGVRKEQGWMLMPTFGPGQGGLGFVGSF